MPSLASAITHTPASALAFPEVTVPWMKLAGGVFAAADEAVTVFSTSAPAATTGIAANSATNLRSTGTPSLVRNVTNLTGR